MVRRNKVNIGSLITGFGLGSLIGVYLNLIIPTLFQFSNILIWSVSALIFMYVASRKPVFIEYLAYALSVYILLQVAWDWAVLDRGDIRLTLFTNALVLLILNTLTGKVKLVGAKNTLRRAIGL